MDSNIVKQIKQQQVKRVEEEGAHFDANRRVLPYAILHASSSILIELIILAFRFNLRTLCF